MTVEEAIERLKAGAPFSAIYEQSWETAISMAIKALEKQIPKKCNGYCPVCGEGQPVDNTEFYFENDFCPYCGQHLNWDKVDMF